MPNREMRVPGASIRWFAVAATFIAGVTAVASSPAPTLPPVPVPYENPGNEAQRILGKMLFFEEQLSSDGTVACATCHVMTTGGVDPRRERHPGSNGVFGDLGDIMGSPGVPTLGTEGTLVPSPGFGIGAQVTGRTAPTPFTAMFQDKILWDGRATGRFVDPSTGNVAIPSGGALESQALLPLTNSVEMGHTGRDLADVVAKLSRARPLAFSNSVQLDVQAALAGDPTYQELFRRAYGDDAITPARIAMAIATYERTLVPGRTKYDRYLAGDLTALDDAELRGLEALSTAQCVKCHAPPLFTDGTFRTTGVRGPFEDLGLAAISKNMADRGKFKVPTLRNVALKPSFFHDGQRTRLEEAIDFYSAFEVPVVNGVRRYGSPTGSQASVPHEQIADNQDPILSTIKLTPQSAHDILAFLRGALVDERVVTGDLPFDAAALGSQRDDLPVARTEPADPNRPVAEAELVTRGPAIAGNDEFAVTIFGGAPGHSARLVSWFEPLGDNPVRVSDPIAFENADGKAFASAKVSLKSAKTGSRLHYAWRVADPLMKGHVTTSALQSVLVGTPRPNYVNGIPVGAEIGEIVDGADAFVESARYSVDYARPPYMTAADTLSVVARLDTAASGVDLRSGRVSLTVGGVAVLTDVALDAEGRVGSANVTGLYDRTTGRLTLSARGLDLTAAILTPSSVPVRIELSGLSFDEPAATTTLNFTPRAAALDKPSTGRFRFVSSGTGSGVFRVTSVKATPAPDGRFRLRLVAALDAPGAFGPWTNGSVEFVAGSHEEIRASQEVLSTSRTGSYYSLPPAGDLAKLRIDLGRRTLFADFTIALPELASAAPGTTVRVPLVFRTTPEGASSPITYLTSAEVTAGSRKK